MLKSPLLEGLNEAQREAVMHGEGPALVVAGPGSGKTLTIIRRLLYLMYERNVPADKILVITYTKEAALSMQDKFYEQQKQFISNKNQYQGFISFGTFHSYFYQIIKNIKEYSEYQLITPQEKKKLATKILKEKYEEISDFSVKRFLEQVSFYKNTGKQKDEEDISELLQRYQTELSYYKRMDFDDMLFLCKKEFLEDKKLLYKCSERYEYVLIDEYQDINPIQYELIHLLTHEKQNLFVVGDDDQAIYGFRGSDGECFQKLLNDYCETRQIFLNINYRCTENIVEASQRLILKNKMRLSKEIVSGLNSGIEGKINIVGSLNTHKMYERLWKEFADKEITSLNEEAVLFRTNAALQSFANYLLGKNIPFVLREKIQYIYDHFIARDIIDYYMAANGCKDRALYLRIFQKSKLSISREILKEEQVEWEIIKMRLTGGFYEDRMLIQKVEMLGRHLNRLKKMRPRLGIIYILHAMNYEEYLSAKAGNQMVIPDEWREVLEWLQEDMQEYLLFSDWFQHIEECRENMECQLKEVKQTKTGVHLMTMHGAKGLEFQKVYILNLNDGIIPKLKRGESITDALIEEERRIFYVALTRAKEELELHFATGTKESPRLMSRFLEEMGYDETI